MINIYIYLYEREREERIRLPALCQPCAFPLLLQDVARCCQGPGAENTAVLAVLLARGLAGWPWVLSARCLVLGAWCRHLGPFMACASGWQVNTGCRLRAPDTVMKLIGEGSFHGKAFQLAPEITMIRRCVFKTFLCL